MYVVINTDMDELDDDFDFVLDEGADDVNTYSACNSETYKQQIIDQIPWTEKYRPKNINDVYLNIGTLNKLNKFIKDKDMPHIILSGIPGSGKTTTIKCMINGLYGIYKDKATLELNASDERGIRSDDLITNFCKKYFYIPEHDIDNVAQHKLLFLDEADNMTEKAQCAINAKMEEFGQQTRFAFTCNKSSDIIEAIQSRCILIKYEGLTVEFIISKLTHICKTENILNYDIQALYELAIISQGDMRNAINNLQATYNNYEDITINNVYSLCTKPQPMILFEIIKYAKKQNIKECFCATSKLINSGYSETDIVMGMYNLFKYSNHYKYADDVLEKDKIELLRYICEYAFIIANGVSSKLQVFGLVSKILLHFK